MVQLSQLLELFGSVLLGSALEVHKSTTFEQDIECLASTPECVPQDTQTEELTSKRIHYTNLLVWYTQRA